MKTKSLLISIDVSYCDFKVTRRGKMLAEPNREPLNRVSVSDPLPVQSVYLPLRRTAHQEREQAPRLCRLVASLPIQAKQATWDRGDHVRVFALDPVV